MYINIGDKLFLPENDDFSKQGFDRHREEMDIHGQMLLNVLRENAKKEEFLKTQSEKQRKAQGVSKNNAAKTEKKSMTYKELFEATALQKNKKHLLK